MISTTSFWKYFDEICKIPRSSGNCSAIIKHIEQFAKANNLDSNSDDAGNIVIRKPATIGMESRPAIILQGHVDMVPQIAPGTIHDFTKDSIKYSEKDGKIFAQGTTLGADNGVAVASMMAVLASTNMKHPALECLFTVDEEIGMLGAFGLDSNALKGDVLLNLDSEEEGELIVGCCGATRAECKFMYSKVSVPKGDAAYKISVQNLKGGHSGLDIHLQRANAIKCLSHFLKTLVRDFEARVASIEGGTVCNAIPNEASAIITIPAEGEDDLYEVAQEFQEIFENEYKVSDPEFELIVESVSLPEGLLPEPVQDDIINAIVAVPNGVYRYSPTLKDVVETSSNLSSIHTKENNIVLDFLFRSTLDSMKGEVKSMIESIFLLAGASVRFWGNYDGWEPNMESEILKKVVKCYKYLYKEEPRVSIIHAGLECGIFSSIYPNLDMLSFGPTIKYPHSVNENLDINSVERFWKLLVAILED